VLSSEAAEHLIDFYGVPKVSHDRDAHLMLKALGPKRLEGTEVSAEEKRTSTFSLELLEVFLSHVAEAKYPEISLKKEEPIEQDVSERANVKKDACSTRFEAQMLKVKGRGDASLL
jgi:hypothetical protein